jgi:hypothetical protein
MLMDSGVECQGEIFKKVLSIPVDGAFVQMWVRFNDDTFQDRFIGDDSICSFEFARTVRDENRAASF